MRPSAPLAVLAVLVALVAFGAGCGDDDAEERACAPEIRERLDPNSTQHLLPGADEPEYVTDPPTSGAHLVGSFPQGVLDQPMAPGVQVTLLEAGEVLVQHRDLDADERERLEHLARALADDVTVAPNPDLPARVVLTAWTYKQECRGIDEGTLRRFVDAHGGRSRH